MTAAGFTEPRWPDSLPGVACDPRRRDPRQSSGARHAVRVRREGRDVVLLLTGGDKSSQANDIRSAQALRRTYEEATRHGTKKSRLEHRPR